MKKKEIEDQNFNNVICKTYEYGSNLILDPDQVLTFIEKMNPNDRLNIVESFRGLKVKYRIKELICNLDLYGYKIVVKFEVELRRSSEIFRFEILRGYDSYNEEFKLELGSILYYVYSKFSDFDYNKKLFYHYTKYDSGKVEFNENQYNEDRKIYEGMLRIFSKKILYLMVGKYYRGID